MFQRNLEQFILKYAKEYPLISIVGPRQSGKTTIAKKLFTDYQYISFENLDYRKRAQEDPRGFFSDIGNKVILDEFQRVPEIFSYLQEIVDNDPQPAQYILTGSQQFLLMEKISQSLAGRIINFKLFPLTVNELFNTRFFKAIDEIFQPQNIFQNAPPNLDQLITDGLYPRIYDQQLTAGKWLENYVITYIERDIRTLVNIKDLRLFENFMMSLATHSGQILNLATLSNSVGVSQPTVKNWISLLETSGIIFFLKPFYKNFNKRIIKSPKIFFYDTGLLCFLLSIKSIDQLKTHPLYGNIFETFMISEFYKRIAHVAEIPPLYYWRDQSGNEIDLIVDFSFEILLIEIKSAKTFTGSFYSNIRKWQSLDGNLCKKGIVIYQGNEPVNKNEELSCFPWFYF